MLNQAILVGRLVRNPEVIETESGKKISSVTVAVPRTFKNKDGEYDTDFIDCILWSGVAESTAAYCKQGDIIGVKGRIQTRNYQKDDQKKYVTEVIAEKVTFLSSNNKNKSE